LSPLPRLRPARLRARRLHPAALLGAISEQEKGARACYW